MTTEPNIPAIKLMIDALRSGEYSQTQGTLVRDRQFNGKAKGSCCLGVESCELAKPGVAERVGIDLQGFKFKVNKESRYGAGDEQGTVGVWQHDSNNHTWSNLPAGIAEQIFGSEHCFGVQNRLIRMNDDNLRDFKFIARWLEVYFGISK